jgi:hypothetical protein
MSKTSFVDQMFVIKRSNLYNRPLLKCLRTKASQLSRFTLILFIAVSAFKTRIVSTFGVIRTTLLGT